MEASFCKNLEISDLKIQLSRAKNSDISQNDKHQKLQLLKQGVSTKDYQEKHKVHLFDPPVSKMVEIWKKYHLPKILKSKISKFRGS